MNRINLDPFQELAKELFLLLLKSTLSNDKEVAYVYSHSAHTLMSREDGRIELHHTTEEHAETLRTLLPLEESLLTNISEQSVFGILIKADKTAVLFTHPLLFHVIASPVSQLISRGDKRPEEKWDFFKLAFIMPHWMVKLNI